MWLLNLGFAGGDQTEAYAQGRLYIDAENTKLVVNDSAQMLTVYKDSDTAAKKRVQVDWTDWLDGSTISTVTWSSAGNILTISNTSNDSSVCTAYVTGGALNSNHEIYCKIVTADAVPRTEVRTILVKVRRISN